MVLGMYGIVRFAWERRDGNVSATAKNNLSVPVGLRYGMSSGIGWGHTTVQHMAWHMVACAQHTFALGVDKELVRAVRRAHLQGTWHNNIAEGKRR